MSGTFFKSVLPDGTDFHTGTVRWLPADGAPVPEGGWLVEHPQPGPIGAGSARGYLSASTVETDCTGFRWPARLLLVEPDGAMWTPHPNEFPSKRAAHAWRVVRELPAWRLFGPQGRQVAAIIEQTADLTSTQIEDLSDAWGAAWYAAPDAAYDTARVAALDTARVAAWDAARDAARDATWVAAWVAARLAAWYAARDAVLGALVADVLDPDTLRLLVGPWVSVMGRSWEVAA